MADEIKKDEVKDEVENKGKEALPEGGIPESGKGAGNEDESEEAKNARLKEEEEEEIEEIDTETLALAKLFKDPQTRSAVIAALTKDSNVEEKISEGQSSKQIVRSMKDDLRKTLGTDWEFLADKLAPVFDAMVTHIAQMEAKLGNQISQQTLNSANTLADQFFEKNPEAKKYENTMIALMEEFEPPKDHSKVPNYLKRLYTLAKDEAPNSGKRDGKSLVEKVKERVERNSQGAALKTGSKDAEQAPKVYKTPREATLAALEMLQKQSQSK